MKSYARAQALRLQRGYDQIFRKFAESPMWHRVCEQVFGKDLGQYSFTPASQIHFLVKELTITSSCRVLDLACGVGGLSCYLAELAKCQVVGVDGSIVAVEIANKQALSSGLSKRVKFEACILPEIPYQDSCFDVVISIDSVYGIPDKSRLLRNCHRVLKPGGYIGLYTLYERRKIFGETAMHTRALYWFPLKPYSVLLKEAGFNNIAKIDFTEDFLNLAGRWVEAIQENKEALEKELGKKTIDGLLTGDIRIAWELGREGLIGRALFKAQKPPNGKPQIH
jgi:cyclopropane fatty-acyl-phospholipid synthase-like methyltransferase